MSKNYSPSPMTKQDSINVNIFNLKEKSKKSCPKVSFQNNLNKLNLNYN